MRKLVLAVVMVGGCSGGALQAPVVGNTCTLDLELPISLHAEAENDPACPPGAVACELPDWCAGYGSRLSGGRNEATFFTKLADSKTLEVVSQAADGENDPHSFSFVTTGYNCATRMGGAARRYEADGRWNLDFDVDCSREIQPDLLTAGAFTVKGSMSGPLSPAS